MLITYVNSENFEVPCIVFHVPSRVASLVAAHEAACEGAASTPAPARAHLTFTKFINFNDEWEA